MFSSSAAEKARLEELNGKLASPSLKGSAQMYPVDFEKVRQECSNTSASDSAAAAHSDRVGTVP